jgi:DNA-binding MarR family transcriptional regulator
MNSKVFNVEQSSTEQTTSRQARIKALGELFLSIIWIGYRQMVQRLQSHGLTHPQFITLASLVAHKSPATMRELSGVTMQDAPTMTGIVDRLVKMGLVVRTRDEKDRRLVLVAATPAGQALKKTVEQDLASDDVQGWAALSDDYLDRLEEMLDLMLAGCLHRANLAPTADVDTIKQHMRQFTNDPIDFMKMLDSLGDGE